MINIAKELKKYCQRVKKKKKKNGVMGKTVLLILCLIAGKFAKTPSFLISNFITDSFAY